MQAVLDIIGPIFWGLVTFSILVFVHEGGHFLAARACGVRVTEFFLGMPCRYRLSRVSRRIGTRFGITPLLIGGYAAICGMDPTHIACAPAVLSYVHRKGRTSVADIARDLAVTEDDALEACVVLMGWGSLAPIYDESKGEGPTSKYYPTTYAAMPRDAEGDTVYDGRAFDRTLATAEGEPWMPPMGEKTFYARERERTYIGKGFWKRAFMLVAGIGVNILTGLLLMVAVYSIIGVQMPRDVSVIGAVTASSPAEKAGLEANDHILSIDDAIVTSWTDILTALEDKEPHQEVQLEVWRPHDARDTFKETVPAAGNENWFREHGTFSTVTVQLDADGMLGIEVSEQTVRLNPIDSCKIAVSYIAQTAQMVSQLLVPSHTVEVLNNSTSIVGISVMSSQAAASGPATFLNFMALISFSLAFMNLLPLPPLDGGKLLIEIIQAVTRREVPLKVQNYISMAVIVLFLLLFVYMLRADFLRFF